MLKRKCKCSGWCNLDSLKELSAQPGWYKTIRFNELQIRHADKNFNTYHYLNFIFILITHSSLQGCSNKGQVYSWIALHVIWWIGRAFLMWVLLAWHCSALETDPYLEKGQFDGITVWGLGISVSIAMPARNQSTSVKSLKGEAGTVQYGPCAENDEYH